MQLGIDAGATSTKWSLAEGGRLLARGEAPALTGHLFNEGQRQDAATRLEQLRESITRAGLPLNLRTLVAGVTGLNGGEPAAETLRHLLARTFELPPGAVQVHSDLHLTYLAYHAPGVGALLYVGTGSVAYLLDQHGQERRAGGYGYLLGDEGGALWLVRESLRRLLRLRDEGQPAPPVLSAKLRAALGDLDWPTLRARAYGGERGQLARLAPLVSEAAQEADSLAAAVCADGARELVRLVRCVTGACSARRHVTVCGGAVTPSLLVLLRAHLTEFELDHGHLRISDANALRAASSVIRSSVEG